MSDVVATILEVRFEEAQTTFSIGVPDPSEKKEVTQDAEPAQQVSSRDGIPDSQNYIG